MAGFEDVVLPIFDTPAPKAVRAAAPTHHSDVDRVGWRRHKPNSTNCDTCTTEYAAKERTSIHVASHLRLFKGQEQYLCHRHAVVQRHSDQLAGLHGAT